MSASRERERLYSTVIDSLGLHRDRIVSFGIFEKHREDAQFAGQEVTWVGIPTAALSSPRTDFLEVPKRKTHGPNYSAQSTWLSDRWESYREVQGSEMGGETREGGEPVGWGPHLLHLGLQEPYVLLSLPVCPHLQPLVSGTRVDVGARDPTDGRFLSQCTFIWDAGTRKPGRSCTPT